ncbi:DNA-directed RNA polymerase subunit beta [Salinithrix halophila]|uniref:DNA-directed RNA polymerase subunit beta n=1 Tax=Salinithrix halophila TaxID=1485204 RepID=A0ABV8JG31_9BACL
MQGNDQKQPRIRENENPEKQEAEVRKEETAMDATRSEGEQKAADADQGKTLTNEEEASQDKSTVDKEEASHDKSASDREEIPHKSASEKEDVPEDKPADKEGLTEDPSTVDEAGSETGKSDETGSGQNSDRAEETHEKTAPPHDWEERLQDDWGIGSDVAVEQEGKEEKEDPDTSDESGEPGKGKMKKPAGELMWKKPTQETDEDPEPPSVGEIMVPPEPEEVSEVPAKHSAMSAEEEKEGRWAWLTRRRVLMFTFVWFPLLAIAALAGGLLIGYSVIGDDPAGDVFTKRLWEHLYNLIYG